MENGAVGGVLAPRDAHRMCAGQAC
jgi:hypothetical protein